jgi:hypothetical protein
MKGYEGVDLYIHAFVNLSLHECVRLGSGSGLFYSWGKICCYPLIKRPDGSQGGTVALEKMIFF